jgi:signal peptidase II
MARKARVFWPILLCLLLVDCTTKRLAVEHLSPPYVPHAVLGDVLRFTLAYNTGAATGIRLGAYSRSGLTLLTLVALCFLGAIYRRTTGENRWQTVALALVCGGALGNLFDRLRWTRGVVDFVDVGLGTVRFWTFNVADIGVTLGAALLVWQLWRRDTALRDTGTAQAL